ncbi:hypothetical protein IQ269_07755 [Tychonema sp. LEGE 07199]|uniref:hypothetical protein n=1 Tax=unclassified Tychonema TaxID=2642144 RepID=UPI0018807BFF|nr:MULTISPECIES: hypothetical protein [unclassified Tychonema]MBE9120714.1 hypothetical protein [Tychonema sp. LEGE 07199]MBE9133104.1 hypothetical protein [Tychonema sp. LEGE 07196]
MRVRTTNGFCYDRRSNTILYQFQLHSYMMLTVNSQQLTVNSQQSTVNSQQSIYYSDEKRI